jgi:hypothetical protein
MYNETDSPRVKIDRRQLSKDVGHYFLACVSSANRGYARETELRKLFINTGGKEFREGVIAEVITRLDDLFGVKVHHDKQGQRYFLSKKNIIPPQFNEMDCMERTREEATNVGIRAFCKWSSSTSGAVV